MIDQETGYGRYDDDGKQVGCPRARSDMTPCIARDGKTALADDNRCVGCMGDPAVLLKQLRVNLGKPEGKPGKPAYAAKELRDLVRTSTEHLTVMVAAPSRYFKGRRIHKKDCRFANGGNCVEMTLKAVGKMGGVIEDCGVCGGRQ